MNRYSFLALALGLLLVGHLLHQSDLPRLLASNPGAPLLDTVLVSPTVETDPVPSGSDAADDPAIWIHPTDTSLSTIIGTDKQGGLAVYDLDGNQLQYVADGNMNNVDLRYNFPLGGESVALVTAGNRTNDSIAIYKVDPATRQLVDVAADTFTVNILSVYGSCMYHSAVTGKYYFIVNDHSGNVEQWELFDNGAGQVSATSVRPYFDVGQRTEGCVADDELGYLYIGEEDTGIWKYGAEPDDGDSRTLVDDTTASGHLTPDIEGLTMYYGSDGTGYLIASSQGSDEFVIYQRGGANDYLATFQVVDGAGVDGVDGTDGIDVTNFPLGLSFPQGVFVTQDNSNDVGNQNYKLVPWEDIAQGGGLATDTTWDPRLVGLAVETCQGETATIVGTSGPDLLIGTSGKDVIVGLGGNDIIKGRAGDDVICGGEGDDQIYGEAGSDAIYGDDGDDVLNGGRDADTIYGGDGNDEINGYLGNDELYGDGQIDTLNGGPGDDTLYGGPEGDLLNGGPGDDELNGDAGDDKLNGGIGVDQLNGGDDNDILNGSADGDIMNGGAGNDHLNAGLGNDYLSGQDGLDTLNGSTGDDELMGGSGDDLLRGGDDTDTCHGEDGVNLVIGCEL